MTDKPVTKVHALYRIEYTKRHTAIRNVRNQSMLKDCVPRIIIMQVNVRSRIKYCAAISPAAPIALEEMDFVSIGWFYILRTKSQIEYSQTGTVKPYYYTHPLILGTFNNKLLQID